MQGPYTVTVKKYEFCNGPKRKNLTNVTLDIDVDRRSGVFNINYLTNTRIDEVSFTNNNFNIEYRGPSWRRGRSV